MREEKHHHVCDDDGDIIISPDECWHCLEERGRAFEYYYEQSVAL